jgi:[protein-PII] uridylyltransferase
MRKGRAPLLADDTRRGAAWCRAHSDLADAWLASLWAEVVGDDAGAALVAVGGYGRAELAPQSDIDVMLVHDGRRDIKALADRLWYPVWDAGVHLGHSVRTVRQAVDFAADDLDTATALLSARLVAGEGALAARLAEAGEKLWQRKAGHWLGQLAARVRERHQRTGEVAFLREPDLKDGRGGLRDVHSLRWAKAAGAHLADHDEAALAAAYDVLLDARVEMQRRANKPGNVLNAHDQAAVAAALGDADGPSLMKRVAHAARLVAWTSDDTWRQVESSRRGGGRGLLSRRPKPLGGGIVLDGDEVALAADAPVAADPVLALRLAAAAASHGAAIDRSSLERLVCDGPGMPEPWPAEALALLVALLRTGPSALPVIEALDQRGLWAPLLPEWEAIRCLPHTNPYHLYTVDRHSVEAAVHAARLAPAVSRPDLLVLAALLHEVGQGGAIGARLGLSAEDAATLDRLIEHHLLLPDVATRRDLDDPGVIDRVAAAMGTAEHLALQAALAEADALATGPAAWSTWKADMIGLLVERAGHVLVGGDARAAVGSGLPSAELLDRLAGTGRHIEGRGDVVTVVTDDRPGVFSRVAGVLALHGLDVLAASAYSSEEGRALNQFRVVDRFRPETPWPRVTADIERALDGALAINARLTDRARTYSRKNGHRVPTSVTFDCEGSPDATIIDVHTADAVGVLYRITRALAELDLDIRSARVNTMGAEVVDAFYVRGQDGGKVTDPQTLVELERAIVHGLEQGA